MKSVPLLYPHHSVVTLLRKFLRMKGYEILLVDEAQGSIKAVKRRTFKRNLRVDMDVSKEDSNITRLELTMFFEARNKNTPIIPADYEEEKILDSIAKYL